MYKNSRRITLRWILSLVLFGLAAAARAASPADLAATAAKDLGRIIKSHDGQLGPVFVFEESHSSLSGQIEIAHMLVRLHQNGGLRTIGLEGALPSQDLVPSWAQSMPSRTRLRVSARLLGDGEIGSAEFMAAAFPDVKVLGIDDQKDYAVDVTRRQSAAALLYLAVIAEQSMSAAQTARVQALISEKKTTDALNATIDSDPWTRTMHSKMDPAAHITSTEESSRQIDEIVSEARRRKVDVPSELAQDIQALKGFYDATSRRSDTMVAQLDKLVRASHGAPVATTIGAAHTEKMTALLLQHDISYVVIRPNSLLSTDGSALTLDGAAYQRKTKGQSVDAHGLGALLDGRRKPPPVIATRWLADKANIYEATVAVVEASRGGRPPPYNLSSLPAGVSVDQQKIRRIGQEIIFPVTYGRDPKKETIWVRAAYSNNVATRNDVDARISRLLADAGGGGSDVPEGPRALGSKDEDGKRPDTGKKEHVNQEAREVTSGIFATFSRDEATLDKEAVLTTSSA